MAEIGKRGSVHLDLSGLTDSPPVSAKRCCTQERNSLDDNHHSKDVDCFRPENMHLVSVLSNDVRSKRIVLHARFEDTQDKQSIVILEKSAFPNDPMTLQSLKVVNGLFTKSEQHLTEDNMASEGPDAIKVQQQFPSFKSESILTNDVYHRLLVTAGFEPVNSVDMTVIHPAEPHHFKRYTTSGRRIFQETPQVYETVILPYLSEKPRDLSWVDNILNGSAERNRVLFESSDAALGFTLVLDYRWNEKRIQELHCLGIARDPELTCLRDLRARHVPMLEHILQEGRKHLAARYNADHLPGPVLEHQIMAYVHYPPTFYRLHVHFVHVDTGDDSGVRTGRAHLFEEVIRNLQLDGDYYRNRVMSIYLYDDSPMLNALQTADCLTEAHSKCEAPCAS